MNIEVCWFSGSFRILIFLSTTTVASNLMWLTIDITKCTFVIIFHPLAANNNRSIFTDLPEGKFAHIPYLNMAEKEPIRVVITGAAGQIGYSLI